MAKRIKIRDRDSGQRQEEPQAKVDEADPRFASIVRALARRAAREHYEEACFMAKEDSDSEE